MKVIGPTGGWQCMHCKMVMRQHGELLNWDALTMVVSCAAHNFRLGPWPEVYPCPEYGKKIEVPIPITEGKELP